MMTVVVNEKDIRKIKLMIEVLTEQIKHDKTEKDKTYHALALNELYKKLVTEI